MPTLAQVINKINSDITANGNEEITGLVLNSVLLDIVAQINDLTGELNDLSTDDVTSIVNAINSLKQELDDYINSQVGTLTGNDDPNDTEPVGFTGRVGTIYLKMTTIGVQTTPESYWIYTGINDIGWLNLTADDVFKMVVVDHYVDLPAQGQTNRIYFVQDENNTYIWNVNIIPNDYVLVGGVIEGEFIDDTTFNDEFGNPVVPNTGNLYLDTVTGKYYRWDGSYFLPIDQDAGGGVQSIQAGANITVDNTDPQNPIVSSTGGGGSFDQDNIPKLIEVSLTTLGMSSLNSDEEINDALVDYIESLNLTIGEKEIYDFKVTGFPEYTPNSGGGSVGKIQLNKSWGAIGHSIWASDGSLRGIQTIVKEHFEFTAYSKYAYNGASLGGLDPSDSSSILSSTRTSIWTSKDIFTYDSITNDFKRNIPIGDQSDFLDNTGIETYYGALRVLHETLKGLNLDYLMICANALKRNNATYTSWSTNTEGHTLTDYSEALEWVANRLSWRFINQFRDSGINDDNLVTFTSDGLHPNNDGYQRYAGLWISEFKKIS